MPILAGPGTSGHVAGGTPREYDPKRAAAAGLGLDAIVSVATPFAPTLRSLSHLPQPNVSRVLVFYAEATSRDEPAIAVCHPCKAAARLAPGAWLLSRSRPAER
jgi:hypothetical protein